MGQACPGEASNRLLPHLTHRPARWPLRHTGNEDACPIRRRTNTAAGVAADLTPWTDGRPARISGAQRRRARGPSGIHRPPQTGQHVVPAWQRVTAHGLGEINTHTPEQSAPPEAGSQVSRGSSMQANPGGQGTPMRPPHCCRAVYSDCSSASCPRPPLSPLTTGPGMQSTTWRARGSQGRRAGNAGSGSS